MRNTLLSSSDPKVCTKYYIKQCRQKKANIASFVKQIDFLKIFQAVAWAPSPAASKRRRRAREKASGWRIGDDQTQRQI